MAAGGWYPETCLTGPWGRWFFSPLGKNHCYPECAQVGTQRALYRAQKWNPTPLVTQTAVLSHVVPTNNSALDKFI